MYNIKVTRRNHNVTVKRVSPTIRLRHSGRAGQQGLPGHKGDTGVGIPTGGTTGQYLEKKSGSDFDYEWITPAFSGDKNFTAEFGVTDTVAVNHNLNKLPSITILDSAGDEVVGEVEYLNSNQLIVRFMAPFSGKITCN